MIRMQILGSCSLTALLQMLASYSYRKELCFTLYNCGVNVLETDKNRAFGVGVVPCCMYQYSAVYFLIRWM